MERNRHPLPLATCVHVIRAPAAKLAQVFAAMATLTVLAPAAYAQDTGTLVVQVIDSELEEAVPNATIVLSSPRLIGGKQSRTTGLSGEVKFTQLPPGDDYTVSAEHPTLNVSTLTGVRVLTSNSTTVTLKMSETETIVAEDPEKAVNTSSTSRGTVLTKDFLQKVPSGRSYQSATQMAAGVGVGSGTGGNPNMGGAASNENTFMIDGANVTDPVTGTFSVNFNFDAIQQVEVLLGGYMPEYGVSLGGVVNVVTESGSNNLKFNSSVYYTNGDWRRRMDEVVSSDGTLLAPTGFESTFQTINVNALVSGPVVRDKAFFILSYSMERSLISVSGTPQRRDYEGHYVYGKLTVQPSSEHRFTAGLQIDPTTIDNTFQGSPWIKAESQGRQSQGGAIVTGRWQWFLSPDANLDTRVTYQKSFLVGSSVPCTHDRSRDAKQCRAGEEEGLIDWYTPGRIGIAGAYDSVNNVSFDFDDRYRAEVSSKLTFTGVEDPFGGKHDLKFGVSTEQLATNRIVGRNGNLVYYDVNATAFDPSSFTNYYWLETSAPIKYRNTGSIYSFFLQDQWKPVKNLTVNYGTRYDNVVMRNDLGEATLKGNLWGPRLFASWDPWGDQKTKIATGWGRFNDRGTLSISGFTDASGFGSKLFLGEFFDRFTNTTGQNWSYTPIRNLNTRHDNLRNPYTDEVILTVEREIITDVALSSSMSGKFSRNIYEYDDTNLMFSQNGDSIIGARTGDPNNLYGRLRTPSLARRDVFQWDLSARKVMSNRWSANAVYTYMRSNGSSSSALSGSFGVDPQTQYNYGQLFTDQNHVFRLLAVWDLPTDPWQQEIGVFFVAGSGVPVERVYYSPAAQGYGQRLFPRGPYTRMPGFWDLSIRFSQNIDVRKGQLKVTAEAQNITNNRGGGFISAFQLAQNSRYVLSSRQDPFRLQLGATYSF